MLLVESFTNVGLKSKGNVTITDEDIIGTVMDVTAGVVGMVKESLKSGFYERPIIF